MIVLVLAAALISPAPPATSLVGLWESARTSKGGIGHTLEFRAGGAFVDAVTVIVDGYYRVVGDRLVVGEHPAADPDASKAPRFKIEDDVLVQTGPDGSVVRKARLGRAEEGKPAIVGEWRYRHDTKAIAFERYTGEGRMFFRLPMSSSVGRYSLKTCEIVLILPNRPDVTMTLDVRGDELSLSGSDGRTTVYRRVTAGAWYDTEHIDRQQ